MSIGSRRVRVPQLFDDRSRYVDSFGWLLGLSAATVVLLSLVDLYGREETQPMKWTSFGVTCLVATTMSVALRASGMTRSWQRAVDAVLVFGVAIVFVVTAAASEQQTEVIMAPFATLLLSAIAPVVVVRRLVRHRRITRGTLLGAISAYLLIALGFFYAFLTTNRYQHTPFFGAAEPTTSYMYFSLTSVTTLGYGDLVAHGDVARLLATTEAVVGQVYLVTFVAMVVALLAQSWVQQTPGEKPQAGGTEAQG